MRLNMAMTASRSNDHVPTRYDTENVDLASVDGVLSTTRSVRLRLDLDRPVPNELILDCIDIAEQGPGGGNQSSRRWLIVRDPDQKKRLSDLYWESAGKWMVSARDKLTGTEHRNTNVMRSAAHLAENLDRVPALIIPCIWGVHDDSKKPGLFDSVVQSAWSFCLAARARGLATAWTTAILNNDAEIREVLGIPDGVTPIALLPVAFSIGGDFASIPRRSAEEVTYFDNWGHTWEQRDDQMDPVIGEGPGVTVELDIDASPAKVWSLISDINVGARFSEEFQGATWIEPSVGPDLGAQFIGTNKHPKIGEWQTTSTITELKENELFGWAVGDEEENAAARWRWEIDELHGQRCRLRHTVRLGPGPSGLTPAIEAMPDKEALIIARRQQEHLANMRHCVQGVKALAENL